MIFHVRRLYYAQVVRNLKDSTVFCSCNHIGRHGYLCRHVFKVLLNAGVESIPEKKHFEKMET